MSEPFDLGTLPDEDFAEMWMLEDFATGHCVYGFETPKEAHEYRKFWIQLTGFKTVFVTPYWKEV